MVENPHEPGHLEQQHTEGDQQEQTAQIWTVAEQEQIPEHAGKAKIGTMHDHAADTPQ